MRSFKPDWYDRLSNGPFEQKMFGAAQMRRIEERVRQPGGLRRTGKRAVWSAAAGIVCLVVLAAVGYGQSWFERGASPESTPGNAAIQPSPQPSATVKYLTQDEAINIAKAQDPNGSATWQAAFEQNHKIESDKPDVRPVWNVEADYKFGNKMIVTVDAVTGDILSTSDIEPPSKAQQGKTEPLTDVRSIHMNDAASGWSIAGSKVLRTTDGGQTWQDVSPKEAPFGASTDGNPLMDANAAYPDSGTAVMAVPQSQNGKTTVYRTTDAGKSWSKTELVSSTFPQGTAHVTTVTFADRQHGWILLAYDTAMGSESVGLYSSSDSGASWSLVSIAATADQPKGSLPLEGIKNGVVFRDAQNGWLTGSTHGNGVWLYATHDGGQTWAPQTVEIPKGYSADGGAASSEAPVFFSAQEGVLPVEFRSNQAVYFYKTEDGGKSWTPMSSIPISDEVMDTVWTLTDDGHGFAAGAGKWMISSDSGKTWSDSALSSKLSKGIWQLSFADAKTGIALGDKLIMKTTDGGRTWSQLDPVEEK